MKQVLLRLGTDDYSILENGLPAEAFGGLYLPLVDRPLGGVFYDHLVSQNEIVGIRYWISDPWPTVEATWKLLAKDVRVVLSVRREYADIFFRSRNPSDLHAVTLEVVQQFDQVCLVEGHGEGLGIYIEVDTSRDIHL
ncbi:MAG: hypothetical protein JSR41_18780 [Proteobacteria bacterium]|nr:hypothetical protein [Pseudomonadota bacterium]